MSTDLAHMRRALELAERGLYSTTPNPRVGCVIVRDATVVGEGWHHCAGEPHAEVNALREAGEKAKGATVYVNLEPCSHHGRTPPCVDALIAAGVARVVAAMQDPNPRVSGSGFAALRAAGVVVESGVQEVEARDLNIGFVSRMVRGRPWVRVKLAASLDGKTALNNGSSQWITGPEARADGHRWRARACAILTGSGTVTRDDPQLTVRGVETTRQPLRVIVDSDGKIAPTARVLQDGNALLFHSSPRPLHLPPGNEAIALPDAQGKVNLPAMLELLGKRGINELHVEAGSRLNGALLRAGLVDELLVYFAPRLMGDLAWGMFELPALESLNQTAGLEFVQMSTIGPDLRILARVAPTGYT